MKKLFAVLPILLAAMTAAALAQKAPTGQPARVEATFTDVPVWTPGSASPPAELADDQYVYIDLLTKEYVISYPEGLERGEKKGARITLRHEPGWVVEPEISATVTKANAGAPGLFRYDYTVKNKQDAKKAIWFFRLVAASNDDSVVAQHPRWKGVSGSPNVAPQAGMLKKEEFRVRANMGKFVGWTSSTDAAPIEPGKTESGFRLLSDFRPGLTTAYSDTGNALRTPSPLPPQVMEQLIPLLLPEKNSRIVVTIGPKFGPGGPQSAVWKAADYLLGVQRLIMVQRLSADSAFVKELISTLQSITTLGSAADGVPDPISAPINIKAAPTTQLERELLQAVQLAFA